MAGQTLVELSMNSGSRAAGNLGLLHDSLSTKTTYASHELMPNRSHNVQTPEPQTAE
jgi:hypothetical protein